MSADNAPSITYALEFANIVREIPGDCIEIGVFCGRSFANLAKWARTHSKHVHGVDSFSGMGRPGPYDLNRDGSCTYPQGRFDVGGAEKLKIAMMKEGLNLTDFTFWEGFVPEILDALPERLRLSFSFLDLDHYYPTLCALHWVWPRTVPGGIVSCHDWVPSGENHLATRAIREFLNEPGVVDAAVLFAGSGTLVLRKPLEAA